MFKKIFLSLVFLLLLATSITAQEVLHDFNSIDGANPRGPLLLHQGYFYGVTFTDATDRGAIYRIKPDGSDFEVLHFFDGTHGLHPNYGGVVTEGVKLYGMTSSGGSFGGGVLYSINLDGSDYQVIYNFTNSSGREPYGAPYLRAGYIYGLTRWDGPSSVGTFFRINKDGSEFTVLKGFAPTGSEGREPHHNLVSDGERFYFMTTAGGVFNNGTISSIRFDGSDYQVLHSFAGAPVDGDYPGYSSPVLVGDYLYGLTWQGGDRDEGVIYKTKKDGTGYEVLHHASSVNDVSFGWQTGSLIEYKADLYGLANGGGANNEGAIFRYNTESKTLEIMASLDNSTGIWPRASLIYHSGYLFGNCYNGGANSAGTVFRYKFEETRGDIGCAISPAAALNAGARWRLSFQEGWRQSGKKAEGVPPGTYTVVFKTIEGWKKPAAQQVTVGAGGEVQISGVYTRTEADKEYGRLKVFAKPNSARKADAKWTVVGSGTWHSSGEKITLPTGNARVKFSHVKGFSKPDPVVVTIFKNTTTVITRSYEEK